MAWLDMNEFFTSANVVNLILAVVLLEAIVLTGIRARTGRGPAAADLLWNLLAGVGLLLALRGALLGAHWQWIAAALLFALVAHLADLRRRTLSRT